MKYLLKDSKIEFIKIYECKKFNRTMFNAKMKMKNESYAKVISRSDR